MIPARWKQHGRILWPFGALLVLILLSQGHVWLSARRAALYQGQVAALHALAHRQDEAMSLQSKVLKSQNEALALLQTRLAQSHLTLQESAKVLERLTRTCGAAVPRKIQVSHGGFYDPDPRD